MSEKQPLVSGAGEPSAPPPPYPAQPPAYTPQAPQSTPYPPPQAPTYAAYPPGAYPGYSAAPPHGAYPGYSAAPPLPPGAYQPGANVPVVQGRQGVAGGCGGTPRVFVEVKPPSYVVMSVIVLLFFNLPLGIIALIHSLQVDSAWHAGDRARARLYSQRARKWNIAGILFGVAIFVLIIVIVIIDSSVVAK